MTDEEFRSLVRMPLISAVHAAANRKCRMSSFLPMSFHRYATTKERLLADIRDAAALTGRGFGRRRQLNRAVSRYVMSPHVQCVAFARVCHKVATEQPQYIPRLVELLPLIHLSELDPRTPTSEPVRPKFREKRGGGTRVTYEFGPLQRSRQTVVLEALEAAYAGGFSLQSMYCGRSRAALREQVRSALTHPGNSHFAVADVQSFFSSLAAAELQALLPLPASAVKETVLSHLKGDDQCRTTQHSPWTVCHTQHRRHPVDVQSRRGLPEGSSCSPIIAYAMLESAMRTLSNAGIHQWADNILIVGSSRQVHDTVSELRALLRRHPAGPLDLTVSEVAATDRVPVDFLGLRFTCAVPPIHDSRGSRRVRVDMSPCRRSGFLQAVSCMADAFALGQEMDVERCFRRFEGMIGQCLSDDRAELSLSGRLTLYLAAEEAGLLD